ncbi:MAG TPA: hypothetical protein PKD78_10965, partial [Saprospiraceae bacterium]|nr:hypothetical protein [Saprospiraceae bacterium]
GLLITNPSNGCTATSSVVVLENKTAPPAEAGLNAPLPCKNPTAALSGNAGQTGAYTFQWSSPDGHFLSDPALPQVTVDSAGLYRLLVTDPANGCTASDSLHVFSNQVIPALSLLLPDTLTCLVKEVNFGVSISPAGFHTTQWSTLDGHFTAGQNTPSARADQPGFYQLLVTNDVNGCTQTASLSVRQDTLPPGIQLPATGSITCAFPTRAVTAQVSPLAGNFDYAWTAAAGGNIISPADGPSITVNAGGSYTLLVTHLRNGCTAQQTLSIGQDTQVPSAEAGPADTLTCQLGSLSLKGSASAEPGLNFLWTASNGGHIQGGANTLQPAVDQPGLYTLLVSNPVNGCFARDSVQIFNDLNKPLANAGKADTLTCVRTSITLAGTGSAGPQFAYLWTAAGTGHLLGDPTTLTPGADQPGIYTLAVTNTSNGCVTTSSVTVVRNITPPSVNAGPDATLTCALVSLQLHGSSAGGPATYAWAATNGGNIVSGNNTPTPTINRSGTYTLTVTLLANGCTATDVAQVGIDTLRPAFSIEPPLLLTCVQKTTALVASVQQPPAGQYTAVWTTQDGHFDPSPQPTAVLADLPGLYVLTLTNSLNGCTQKQEVKVLQDIEPPTAQVLLPDTITCAQTTVTLDGTGSSAGPNFYYQWTAYSGGKIEGGTTALQAVASWAGEYQLKVGDG